MFEKIRCFKQLGSFSLSLRKIKSHPLLETARPYIPGISPGRNITRVKIWVKVRWYLSKKWGSDVACANFRG